MQAGTAETGGTLAAAGAGDPKPKPWLGLVMDGTAWGLLTAEATLAFGENDNPVVEDPKAGRAEGNFSVFSEVTGAIVPKAGRAEGSFSVFSGLAGDISS